MSKDDRAAGFSGAWAVFTKADIQSRWARARKLMDQAGLDTLLICNEENFQYFTGTSSTLGLHYSVTRPAVFMLPITGDPIAVVGELLVDSFKMTSHVEQVEGYQDVVRFPFERVVDALRELGANRIGAELGQEQRMGMPVGDYLSIVDTLSDRTFIDAAPQLIKLRMIKTAEEVAYMRQAADITGRARQRMFDEIHPGMTEREVARLLRQFILEEGGDRTSFIHLISGFPAAHSQHHLDRPLVKGSLLYVDAGAYVRYHTIDYARFATLGPASDEHKQAHAALLEANAAMTSALAPGVTCAELHHIGHQMIENAGYEIPPSGRIGHGQGIQFTEPPSITPDDHTVLEVGMVISTEPEVALDMLWEDVHVITATGSDQLTTETVELRELNFD
ncbi:MAG: Xaa-Pro dipeptidase [Parasphingorhabdus sp.]|jgi:Xaa-Pro dipeptidase